MVFGGGLVITAPTVDLAAAYRRARMKGKVYTWVIQIGLYCFERMLMCTLVVV